MNFFELIKSDKLKKSDTNEILQIYARFATDEMREIYGNMVVKIFQVGGHPSLLDRLDVVDFIDTVVRNNIDVFKTEEKTVEPLVYQKVKFKRDITSISRCLVKKDEISHIIRKAGDEYVVSCLRSTSGELYCHDSDFDYVSPDYGFFGYEDPCEQMRFKVRLRLDNNFLGYRKGDILLVEQMMDGKYKIVSREYFVICREDFVILEQL